MKTWAILMVMSSGLFSGGVTLIAWERVPAWRALPLTQFRTQFATTIRIADRVQPALLLATIVTTIGFGLTANGAARTLAFAGAAGFIVTLAASAVLVPLQRRIIASSGEETSVVEAMPRRWFLGHFGRSALAVTSFFLVAMGSRGKRRLACQAPHPNSTKGVGPHRNSSRSPTHRVRAAGSPGPVHRVHGQ